MTRHARTLAGVSVALVLPLVITGCSKGNGFGDLGAGGNAGNQNGGQSNGEPPIPGSAAPGAPGGNRGGQGNSAIPAPNTKIPVNMSYTDYYTGDLYEIGSVVRNYQPGGQTPDVPEVVLVEITVTPKGDSDHPIDPTAAEMLPESALSYNDFYLNDMVADGYEPIRDDIDSMSPRPTTGWLAFELYENHSNLEMSYTSYVLRDAPDTPQASKSEPFNFTVPIPNA